MVLKFFNILHLSNFEFEKAFSIETLNPCSKIPSSDSNSTESGQPTNFPSVSTGGPRMLHVNPYSRPVDQGLGATL